MTRTMTRILFGMCAVLASVACTFGDCHPPQYHTGSVLADSGSELIMNISVPLRDFAPGRLVCLAMNLKEHYRERRNVIVSIFSSEKAASHSTGVWPVEETKGALKMLAEMHARYVFDADRHENYVESIPMPTISSTATERVPYTTRIDLPIATTPHCRLEIDGRCLIALDNIYYPSDRNLDFRASGTVILKGRIARDGKMNGVQVADASVTPDADKGLLVKAALTNLNTWQLEPAEHEDSVRLTYRYVIDPSLPRRGEVDVKFALPDQIIVLGKPSE